MCMVNPSSSNRSRTKEANCHSKPKTSKVTLTACKIRDSVRAVHQGKGQLIADALIRVDPLSPEPQDAKQKDGYHSRASDFNY